ncbi:MAG TPA: CopD family protein [Longimicrobiales bacterium]|nr:CopD family protein [Longimicrobiales bacterium]
MHSTLRIVALILFACIGFPARAAAHLKLESSSPAQGDTVRASLHEIRVVFSQAVEPRYTTLTLLDNGGNALELGTLVPIGTGKTREFVYQLTHPLVAGDFVVRWRTAGEDGHVVSGSFDFIVDVPNAVSSADPTRRPDTPAVLSTEDEHAHHTEAGGEPLYDAESLPWILARWINFVGLVLMVGAVAFRFAVLQRAQRAFTAEVFAAIDSGTRTIALWAALIALTGNTGRFWLQSGALHGSARMWEPELLRAMTFDTGWGKAWLAQTVAALAFIIATRIRSEQPLESWIAAALFAVAAASTPAFSGHAAAVEQMAAVPIFNDAVHLMAASAWLGTLAVLLFAGVPALVRTSHQPFTDAAALVRTFSPLALFAAAVAIATGTMSAFVHIKAISELWTTPYGKTLSLKLMVVLLTATTGAYNWKVVSPRLGTEGATLHIRRSALAEIIIAATILAVTAVLVALPLH